MSITVLARKIRFYCSKMRKGDKKMGQNHAEYPGSLSQKNWYFSRQKENGIEKKNENFYLSVLWNAYID